MLLTGHPLIYGQASSDTLRSLPPESFYGHLEEGFLKSTPAATEAALRDAARRPAS